MCAGEGANTVLAGVLRGCGRQKIGAQINLFMYWGIGLPFACLLAFRMGLGAMGLWTGLACTASLQSLILSWIVFKFDWNAEAQRAKVRKGCSANWLAANERSIVLWSVTC